MTTQNNQVSVDENTRKVALNRRLEGFGWGALLVVIGTIWLLPESQVPHGSWLIAAGIIMLGLNAIRYFNGIKMSGFSLIAGTIALTMGFGEFSGVKLTLIANCADRDRSRYSPEDDASEGFGLNFPRWSRLVLLRRSAG